MKIVLKPGAIPIFNMRVRNIPRMYEEKADMLILRYIEQGIIEPMNDRVGNGWCSAAHYVLKKNGEVRLVIDFRPLNKNIVRAVHPFPGISKIKQFLLPKSKFLWP